MKKVVFLYENNEWLVEVADSIWTRFLGLMGKKRLERGRGLLLSPCKDIHTFFMRFAIDVVALRKEAEGYVITGIRKSVKPWRVVLPFRGATHILELSEGAAEGLHIGERLFVYEHKI